MKQLAKKITDLLASRHFLYAVGLFFVFESLWIAFSSAYPMAFDENFHLGIIKIYADNWLPFLANQPAGADQFGAVFRDPSFLYHWLMSYPYRLMSAVTANQEVVIVGLRLMNVAIFSAALALFYRFMLRAGASRALSHTALALFVLIPIVPLVAGQVNYDSLFMVLVACFCLLTMTLYQQLGKRKPTTASVGLWVLVCMLGCLTKYAFVPFALASLIFLAVAYGRAFRGLHRRFVSALTVSYRRLGRWAKVGLVLALLATGVLFVERYGINTVRYHNPLPDCGAVLSDERCLAYGPWARDYRLAARKQAPTDPNPLPFSWTWVQALRYRLFFMINGPHHTYANFPPLPLPSAAATAIVVTGVFALVFFGRRTFHASPTLVFALCMTVVYLGFLWYENYSMYIETGQPVAINGRYLLPLLLPIAAVLSKAYGIAFSRWPWLKAYAAAIVILLFLQGGGVFSFILRSNATWYWPNQSKVTTINDAARTILDPIIIEGSAR